VIDLALKNAHLLDGTTRDLFVDGGRFVSGGEPRETIDCAGRLVTPPLVDSHLHLDASLTAGKPRFNESGTLIEGIHVWGELKPSLTEQDVFDRASEIVRWSAAQGTLRVCGKPRSTDEVAGSGQREVTTLPRV
jgi:cytosine deaminase